jgi:hypothetical protein
LSKTCSVSMWLTKAFVASSKRKYFSSIGLLFLESRFQLLFFFFLTPETSITPETLNFLLIIYKTHLLCWRYSLALLAHWVWSGDLRENARVAKSPSVPL